MSNFKKIKEKFESKKNIVRVEKNRNNPYVMINKSGLKDTNISWAAKGLHSYLLSLPDDWEIYANELVKHTSSGRDHTYKVINELLKYGYMEKVQYRCEGKVLGLSYTVFEVSTGVDNTNAKISSVTLDDNGEIIDITELQPNTETPYTVTPDTDSTSLLNNNNNEIINKQNNNSVVVVVSEKEKQLLEMYKNFRLEKRIMPHTTKLLKTYVDKFDLDVFEQVFISASDDNVKKKYAYLKEIFTKLESKNIKTIEQYEQDYKEFKKSKKNNFKSNDSVKEQKVKTRFHNITERFRNYEDDELSDLLKGNYEDKRQRDELLRQEKEKQEQQEKLIRQFAIERVQNRTPLQVKDDKIWKESIDKEVSVVENEINLGTLTVQDIHFQLYMSK